MIPDDGPFTIGYKVNFRCNPGYDLIGPESSVCTNEQTWSDDIPFCERQGIRFWCCSIDCRNDIEFRLVYFVEYIYRI